MDLRGFYGVLDLGDGEAPGTLERGRQLAEALVARGDGASILQLRMKGASTRRLLEVAHAARVWTRDLGVSFVVNDRLDVALAVDADGVHLGQDDLPVEAARAALKAAGRGSRVRGGLFVGVSTHTTMQASEAARSGADYLGFGPVFATTTKENPDPVQGLEGLAEAVRAAGTVPVVAIGGIQLDQVAAVVKAGASAACVISAVNGAEDVRAAALKVSRVFQVGL
jgi:thiamine-phosphate pyrophosphorylase